MVRATGRQPNNTVAQLWEAYRQSRKNRRIAQNMSYSGLPIIKFFGDLLPHHVTPELSQEYIALRTRQGRRLWTIHTELNHLRSVLNWAQAGGSVSLPSRPPPRDLYLTKDQARLLINATDGHLKLFIVLALSTGARNGALLDLTWDRVDLSKRLINLRTEDMTNRKGRATIPINNQLYELLNSVEDRSGYVIQWAGRKVTSVKKALKRAATKVGLPWVSPHVFRHSVAVWMAEDGVSMEEIAQFLGHSSVEVTRNVYARFSPTYLQKAAGALEL